MSENPEVGPSPVSPASIANGPNPNEPKQGRTFGWFTVFSLLGIGGVLAALLIPAMDRGSREAARRTQCKNNLKQIALALHHYEERYHALPPAYTVDAYGNTLHSWRTLILPFLDQQQLYESIDLAKPWDDQANAVAFNTPVSVFRCPTNNHQPTHTTYLGNAAANGLFRRAVPRPISEITDGVDQTIMVVEVPAKHSVPWMSPKDADEALLTQNMARDSQLAHSLGTHAALCDGSVRLFSADLPANIRRALISIAGGEKIGDDW